MDALSNRMNDWPPDETRRSHSDFGQIDEC